MHTHHITSSTVKSGKRTPTSLLHIFLFLLFLSITSCQSTSDRGNLPPADPDNGGLLLPDGFEATVVIDSLGPARHLWVNDNGDIYVKARRSQPNGMLWALRDTDGDGKADVVKQFGAFEAGGNFHNDVKIHNDYLYFSTNMEVLRYPMIPGELLPDTTSLEVIVTDDHDHGVHSHQTKPFIFDDDGYMLVPYGVPTDACQEPDRTPGVMGQDPCPDLEQHAGVWRFYADSLNQVQEESTTNDPDTNPTGVRIADGMRSIVGMDFNPVDGLPYAVVHGRDFLFRQWPEYYSRWDSAVLPAEEFVQLSEGRKYGWPFCYYDHMKGKRLLNPEYGGDGETVGRCTEFDDPHIGFPGHFAPNDIHFYQDNQFPEYYKNGAFVALHGSTIRNPYSQAGYFVAFVPQTEDGLSKEWDAFANGFAQIDSIRNTRDASHRPMAFATGPAGSLYISDSVVGKIWRVMYTGDKENFGEADRARMQQEKETAPNIKTPDPVEDSLEDEAALGGETLYRTYCSACHATDGSGNPPRFPPLAETDWVNGNKQRLIGIVLQGLEGEITVRGESYNMPMPAHDFLDDEQISQILTYIRSNFGNDASEVTTEEVREVRERLER